MDMSDDQFKVRDERIAFLEAQLSAAKAGLEEYAIRQQEANFEWGRRESELQAQLSSAKAEVERLNKRMATSFDLLEKILVANERNQPIPWQSVTEQARALFVGFNPSPTQSNLADKLVNAFLAWPLPDSVCSDQCATEKGYPNRSGTNLLTAIEARQMFEYLLGRCGTLIHPDQLKPVVEALELFKHLCYLRENLNQRYTCELSGLEISKLQSARAHLNQLITPQRQERCKLCGQMVSDWVDPDWAKGRICRECETAHEPTGGKEGE